MPAQTISQLTSQDGHGKTLTATGCWTLEQRRIPATIEEDGVERYGTRLASHLWRFPELYRDKDRIDGKVAQKLRECVLGDSRWPLVFYGDAGAGKTCASLCIADWCGAAVYATLSDFHKATFDDGWRYELLGFSVLSSYMWRLWRTCNLAILDEVGERTECSDALYDTLKRAIDLRLNYNQALVVISNEDPRRLVDIYDERIASRLLGGTAIRFTGDRRLGRGE